MSKNNINNDTLRSEVTESTNGESEKNINYNIAYKKDDLFDAIEKGDNKLIESVLNTGVSANSIDESGDTAVYMATLHKNETAIKFLLSKGADINAVCTDGNTPLRAAVSNNDYKMVDYLIEKGIDSYKDPELIIIAGLRSKHKIIGTIFLSVSSVKKS